MKASEIALAERLTDLAADPVQYTLEAYPWGEEATPLVGIHGPRRWQQDVLRDIRDHLGDPETRFHPLRIAVASGHGCGKSSLAAMVTNWALATCPDTRVVITANTEGQLVTKTSPELGKWSRMSVVAEWFKHAALSLVSTQKGHSTSWRADLIPWSPHSPEAFAGLHNQGRRIVLIFDESAAIDDKIWSVAEGALTDSQTEIIWLALGNPTRGTGRFADCFGKHRHLWRTYNVDSRTVEGTNTAYLDELVATYGEDSDIAKVRVRGLFPSASTMQFIGSDIVIEAAERPAHEGAILPSDPVIMGLDHARFGDDSTVLAIRQGRDARSRPWKVWNGANSMEIAGDVAVEVGSYQADAIFIDAGGPNAGGVIDRLRQLLPQLPVFEVNFGGKGREAQWNGEARVRVANKRCEMWTNMRAWLERGAIPNDQRLITDLTAIEYTYTADQAIQLERKEHLKARGYPSSDFGDALALTFAEPVGFREVPSYLDPDRFNRTREYDRFNELDGGEFYDRGAL